MCARRLADNPREYHIGAAAHFNLTIPELFVDNDLCVQWNVHQMYWTSYNIANQEEKPNNTTDGSMTIKTSMSILLLLLLIELALLI